MIIIALYSLLKSNITTVMFSLSSRHTAYKKKSDAVSVFMEEIISYDYYE